jgi:hypothetical protein
MTYSDEVIKVCSKVHEFAGTIARLESEVAWLRETVASLMMKMTYPLQTLPPMSLEDWHKMSYRGPTCTGTGLTVGEGVVPLTVGDKK